MDNLELDYDAPLSETYTRLCVRFRGVERKLENVQEALRIIEKLKGMDDL